jgi:hypothetical protein
MYCYVVPQQATRGTATTTMTTTTTIPGFLLAIGLALGGCADTSDTFASEIEGDEVQEPEAEPEPATGTSEFVCDAVDILFVVDNSPSMEDEQQNLVEAVPGFVEAMRAAFPEIKSVHIGVVDTDAYPSMGTQLDAPFASCPEDADCGACDYTLGALVDKPHSGSAGGSCEFSTGARFMDADSPNFEAEFACAVTVGTEGNPVERQAGALLAAVSPGLSGVGQCNEGFLREDARLVTVMVSDEDDDHRAAPGPVGGSLGEPTEWHEALVRAKGGNAHDIIALGLLGGAPKFEDCAELSVGNEGAELSPRLSSLLQRFDQGFIGSVCGSDYEDFFVQALDAVADSCIAHTVTLQPAAP